MRPSLLQRQRRHAPVPVDAVVDEAAGVEIELAECGEPPVADERAAAAIFRRRYALLSITIAGPNSGDSGPRNGTKKS
jgi:hypothetical protein